MLDLVKHLSATVRTYVEEMMENFDKLLLHLQYERLPSPTNNAERYFGYTKPTLDLRRFRLVEGARSHMKTQMMVRTVKHGLIPRESSLALARELFSTLNLDEATDLFTETKQRYLWSRDLEAG